MAVGSLTNHYPVFATQGDGYFFTCKFETNNTSAPDGVVPSTDGFAVARTGVGDFTITFDEDKKPYDVWFATAQAEEDDAGLEVKVTGYTRATGVLTLTVYDESTGTAAAADTTDKTIAVLALCTRSAEGL